MGGDAKMKLLRWFNAYVPKPLRPADLLETLRRALSSDVDLESADAAEEAGTAGAPEAEQAGQAEPEPSFEASVLLAEDHEVNRELFTLILGRLGCRVVAARDGVEAVEIGSSRSFDIVLMDIFMPRMNGYEASLSLRERGYRGPIIAVTASALKGEREKCVEAGMDDILVKPFKKHDLAAVLAAWLPSRLGGSRAEAEGQAAAPLRSAAASPSPASAAGVAAGQAADRTQVGGDARHGRVLHHLPGFFDAGADLPDPGLQAVERGGDELGLETSDLLDDGRERPHVAVVLRPEDPGECLVDDHLSSMGARQGREAGMLAEGARGARRRAGRFRRRSGRSRGD